MDITGLDALTTCAGCRDACAQIEAFWLVPYCTPCAARHFGFDPTHTNKVQWEAMITIKRKHLLAESTPRHYEAEIKKATWPLRDVLDTMTFLEKASTSPSAMRLAVAAARGLHASQTWSPPPFHHPLIAFFTQALEKRPIQTPLHPKRENVLTNAEVQLIFKTISADPNPIRYRDAAILALQLLGVRRAFEVLNLIMEDV